MDTLDTTIGLAQPKPLAAKATALFLDLDGTLARIAARPQDVGPDPRRSSLLVRLQSALAGRLAVVTGRTLEDADRILENSAPALAAVHGLMRRDAQGRVSRSAAHPAVTGVAETLRAFATRDLGLIVEDKGVSVTLHYRQAPQHAQAAREMAARLAMETGLMLQDGDMVVELRTPGPTKGDSVRAFMATAPFAGSTPVFVGDDLTDEDGFTAAETLGGFGVLVGARRQTRARYGLRGVEETLAWLEAIR